MKVHHASTGLISLLVTLLTGCGQAPATNGNVATDTTRQGNIDSTEITMTLAECAKKIQMTEAELDAWKTNYGYYDRTDSVTEKVCSNIAELMRRKRAAIK